MKRVLIIFCILIAVLFSVSCKKNSDDPETAETMLSDNARAFNDLQQQRITEVSDNSVQMQAETTEPEFAVGDIVASSPIDLAPNGFLRKITNIEQDGDIVVLTTEPACIEDAFEQADIHLEQALRTSDVKKIDYLTEGVVFSPKSKDPLSHDYTLNYVNDNLAPGTTVSITGNLNLNMGYDLQIRTRLGQGLTYLKGGGHIGEQSSLNLDITSTIFSITRSIDLASVEFQPIVFFVSGFPIVVVPRVKIVLNIDAEGSTNIDSEVSVSAVATAGVIYEDGNWSTYQNRELGFEYQEPTLHGNAAASIATGPRLELNLYGVAGPFVTGLGILDLQADTDQSPWWVLRGGFRADVGVNMSAIGYQQDYSYPGLIEYSQLLAESDGAITGTLSGSVHNANTGNPLSDVSVNLYKQGELNYSASTDANGRFSLEAAAGVYTVIFSKEGFLNAEQYDVSVSGFVNNTLQAILQIDETFQGTGSISGYIRNAMTNYGISQVTLQIREGINNLTGEIIATVHTDINGYYLFNDIEAGNYTISCSHVDFVETSFSVICLGGVNSDNQSTVMSPLMNEDEIRIILTWGSSPRDLDSHLTGPIPESEQRFHIYYANKNFYYDDTLYANLDIDDVSSYGPETTTIYVPSQGLYRFSVYDYSNGGYSNSSALSNSSAQVSVWKGNNNIQTYHVPTGEIGTVWTVFELSGNQIIGINTISNDTSYKNEELNWQQLPQK